MPPLIPHLRGMRTFAEPCCGDGALVRHLESFGLRCVYAGDIATGQDALALDHYGAADAIITNPPYTRELMHRLIAHFQRIAPTWLLIDYDWSATKQAAPFMPHCSDIVILPRLKWIEGSKDTGKDNHAWYRFDAGIAAALSSTITAARTRFSFTARQSLRAMPQALRAAAIQFAVLLGNVQAARPSQEALALRLTLRPRPHID